jgi:hypothetical protein
MLGIERKNAPIPFDLSYWRLLPVAAVADVVSNVKDRRSEHLLTKKQCESDQRLHNIYITE